MGAPSGSLSRGSRAVAAVALAGLALLGTLGGSANYGADVVSAQLVPGTPSPTGTPTSTASPGPAGSVVGPGSVAQPEPAGPTPTPTSTVDLCYGDEQLLFAPDSPRVGNELLITVSSAHPHPYGRLAGTERTTFVREHPGQLGTVWEWSVSLTAAGDHEYTFYVDSTIPCTTVRIRVRQSLGSASTSFSSSDNSGDNGSGDNGSGDNDSGDNGSVTVVVVTATPQPSPTPTPTATSRAT